MVTRLKLKLTLMSVMIAMISGFAAGATVACIENKACICKKMKKAFKELEDKML